MKTKGWTDIRLAKLLDRDRSTVTRLRQGKAVPSLDIAVQIERLTDGKVRPASFVRDQPQAAE